MSNAPSKTSLAAERLYDPAWAWAPYQPDAERPWDLRWAGHLYRRAGFGANWDQLRAALDDGPQPTIEKLLRPGGDIDGFNRAHDDYEKGAAQSGSTEGLRAWWLRRMCQTPFPLLEKMTLFWHDDFAISNTHVSNPALMCRYVRLLRQNALGNFGLLLEGIVSEPAVFVSLDARANRKGRPNENLPRVLLEQFTVGPGQFKETDVQATARALTGWFISQDELKYSAREHVSAQSMLLGEAGDFEKKDVVRILLRQRATGQSVVRKLYRWLISETSTPPESLIVPLADSFARNLDIAALVETILRSNLFFSSAAYRQKIKSPVEFALGVIRPLNGVVGTVQLGADLAELGQDLYHPPTMEGWAGNRCWINSFTLLGRVKLARALLTSSGAYGGKLDPLGAAVKQRRQTPEAAGLYLFDLLLQGDVPEQVRRVMMENALGSASTQQAEGERLRQLAVQIAALPEFNLA